MVVVAGFVGPQDVFGQMTAIAHGRRDACHSRFRITRDPPGGAARLQHGPALADTCSGMKHVSTVSGRQPRTRWFGAHPGQVTRALAEATDARDAAHARLDELKAEHAQVMAGLVAACGGQHEASRLVIRAQEQSDYLQKLAEAKARQVVAAAEQHAADLVAPVEAERAVLRCDIARIEAGMRSTGRLVESEIAGLQVLFTVPVAGVTAEPVPVDQSAVQRPAEATADEPPPPPLDATASDPPGAPGGVQTPASVPGLLAAWRDAAAPETGGEGEGDPDAATPSRWKRRGLAAAAALVIVGAVAWPVATAPPEIVAPPVPDAPAVAVGLSLEPLAPPPTPVAGQATVVTLRAVRSCWVRLTIGERAESRLLEAGQELVRETSAAMSIRVGDATALEVLVNGQLLPPVGRDGQVVTRNIAIDD